MSNKDQLRMAILFWFYQDLPVCINRLQLLRKYNRAVPIYGLYGGASEKEGEFRTALEPLLDDWYAYPGCEDASWKWYYGDIMIRRWFSERGSFLSWDTVILVQWDMLLFGSIDRLFECLRPGQILLSGLRPVAEVQSWWNWVRASNPVERGRYLAFIDYVRETYHYAETPLCCQFIVVCLPRRFLDKFEEVAQPELGFIEYKIPILAQIFSVPFCETHPYRTWWYGDPQMVDVPRWRQVLKPARRKMGLDEILLNLINPWGARIFHPYDGVFPLGPRMWLQKAMSIVKRLATQPPKACN